MSRSDAIEIVGEVPSMVHRAGDKLIVRSVVSGNELFIKQKRNSDNNTLTKNQDDAQEESNQKFNNIYNTASSHSTKEKEKYSIETKAFNKQISPTKQGVGEMDTKSESLPQCKIKRNYSCGYCTYFTQNPRFHLTHLRDIHGEKIVINECKMCLYASRHFQKLVRHMKMVHGCTDGVVGELGQFRGKRGISRELRKRKLEESINVKHKVINMTEINKVEDVKISKHHLDVSTTEEKCDTYSASNTKNGSDIKNAVLTKPNDYSFCPSVNESFQSSTISMQTQSLDLAQLNNFDKPIELPSSSSGNQGHFSFYSSLSDKIPQNRLLKCSICNFTTLYSEQLLEHELEEHCKTRFFRCEKCSYVTHIKARYSKHIKYHSMPMIKCVICDFRTPYKWNLDRHMKNHGGTGPFKCTSCDFTADIKQSLTVHEMNHHSPPLGHVASLIRRRNKVGGTDIPEEFLSDSTDAIDDSLNNNNNIDEFDHEEVNVNLIKCGSDNEEPTDLSKKFDILSTEEQHSLSQNLFLTKTKRPIPNLIPINKLSNILDLSKDMITSNILLDETASMLLNTCQEKIAASDTKNDISVTALKAPDRNFCLLKKSFLCKKTTSNKLVENFDDSSDLGDNESQKTGLDQTSTELGILSDEEVKYLNSDKKFEVDLPGNAKQSHSALNLSISGSTRCQNCRHRCKSSIDLLNHLKTCSNENKIVQQTQNESNDNKDNRKKLSEKSFFRLDRSDSLTFDNVYGQSNLLEENCIRKTMKENSYYGVETAPGYGEVTKTMTPEEEAANSSLKKVYKCPHCSFWASTASRFHVHIVGHLNKKPFECSLCSYRSNWRWDITKHIRLKTIRDPCHKNAGVLMNDETGRRNYTKYNKYITLMKVTEEDGDPKLMKSGEMTHNQIASLTLLKKIDPSPVNSGEAFELGSTASSDTCSKQLTDDFLHLSLITTMMNTTMPSDKDQQTRKSKWPSAGISAKKNIPIDSNRENSEDDKKNDNGDKNLLYQCRNCSYKTDESKNMAAHLETHNDLLSKEQNSTRSLLETKSYQFSRNLLGAMKNMQFQEVGSSSSTKFPPEQQALQSTLATTSIQQETSLIPSIGGGNVTATNKISTKPAASILEHGEQKASQNEASALSSLSTLLTKSDLTCLVSSTSVSLPSATPAIKKPLTTFGGDFPKMNSSFLSQKYQSSLLTSYHNQLQQPKHAIPKTSICGVSNDDTNNNNINGDLVVGLHKSEDIVEPEKIPHKPQLKELCEKEPRQQSLHISVAQTPLLASTFNDDTFAVINKLSYKIKTETIGTSVDGYDNITDVMRAVGGGKSICMDHVVCDYINYSSLKSSDSIVAPFSSNTSSISTDSYVRCQMEKQTSFVSSSPSKVKKPKSTNIVSSNLTNNDSILLSNTCDGRDPSPYRCGHCHQVSNWKHVIQRHCRLKHDGVILIEVLKLKVLKDQKGTSSDILGKSFHNNTLTKKSNDLQSNKKDTLLLPQNQPRDNFTYNNNSLILPEESNVLLNCAENRETKLQMANSVGPSTEYQSKPAEQNKTCTKSGLSLLAAKTLRKSSALVSGTRTGTQSSRTMPQRCTLCFYIAETKSEMNYHMSLHKTLSCKKQNSNSHNHSTSDLIKHQLQEEKYNIKTLSQQDQYDYTFACNIPVQMNESTECLKKLVKENKKPPVNCTVQNTTNVLSKSTHVNLKSKPKTIAYCSKCPARFVFYQNGGITANNIISLQRHLKAHSSLWNKTDLLHLKKQYKCELCDFTAAHETTIQTHRYVHTQKYLDKFDKAFGSYQENEKYPIQRLMQSLCKKMPITVKVVDNIISLTNLDETSTSNKHLHVKRVSTHNSKTTEPVEKKNKSDLVANLPSTNDVSIFLQTDQTAITEYETSLSYDCDPENYITTFECKHCSFKSPYKAEVKEHIPTHFKALNNLHGVYFFTWYYNLELRSGS